MRYFKSLSHEPFPMPELLMPYDPAHAMTDPQAVAIFLTDALQTGDAGYVGKI